MVLSCATASTRLKCLSEGLDVSTAVEDETERSGSEKDEGGGRGGNNGSWGDDMLEWEAWWLVRVMLDRSFDG